MVSRFLYVMDAQERRHGQRKIIKGLGDAILKCGITEGMGHTLFTVLSLKDQSEQSNMRRENGPSD